MLSGMLRLVAGIALSDDIVSGGHKRRRKYTRMHTHIHTLFQFFMALQSPERVQQRSTFD